MNRCPLMSPDPDNNDLYQEYVAHRFGRNVDTLDELDVDAIEPWRKKFFTLCRKSLTLNDDKLYDVYVSICAVYLMGGFRLHIHIELRIRLLVMTSFF